MNKKMIQYFLIFASLPFASLAQINIYGDVGAGESFNAFALVRFDEMPNFITNYSCTVDGTNISIQLFTTSTRAMWPVETFDVIFLEFPPLSEGDYAINTTIIGSGSIFPATEYFSVPFQLPYIPPPEHSVEELMCIEESKTVVPVIFERVGNLLEYTHLQRNDFRYTLEVNTNLMTTNTWTSILSTQTNLLGDMFNEVSYSITMTNSQAYFRLKIENL